MKPSAATQYCTFRVAHHLFGLPVQDVQEILLPLQMTPVPLADTVVGGLLNIRGRIVVAIDLRRRLGLARRTAADPRPANVVVRTEGSDVSFLVDEIGDVLELARACAEPPPISLRSLARGLITHVYQLEEELLLALDATRTAAVSAWPADDRQAA
jgi:purine-binding chemotaxis protein CheW